MQITMEETNQMIDLKVEQVGKEFGETAKLLVKEIILLLKSLQQTKTTRYIRLSKWNQYYDYPTLSAMRNYVAKADKNGIDKAIFRNGKNLYIDEVEFFKWLKEGNKNE